MQGILIDPKAKTITTCEVDDKNCLQSLYTLMRCSIVEQVYIGEGDVLLVDEEGKLTYPNKDGYFMIPYIGGIFAGCAVILNNAGTKWRSAHFILEEVTRDVIWCSPTEEQVKPRAFIFSW
jgi:hypothetical protein